ncbi:carboxypeptidase-like regulatory domain-containing protein [Flavobacterium sp. CYK-4]|uniref:carboxypeptidase-like regulatory domain-containing protein n=1 Tax=Flavobacterium lotistagni TaxID=2709660 RepID=UPI00140E0426|nr:carboxypeptidase-like regulatory domain-containing protein [Flavobacterium lotistagni]NHM07581.1 carboxypeptidase-like regulatory domain-containing protein [Flavobacterium lotistagni]
MAGIVYDEKKQPISGAFAYFDQTSISTTTDSKGWFQIQTNNKTYANLVISATGYETVNLKNPFDAEFHTVKMTPKVNQLREIAVRQKKKRFKREDKLKVFRDEFIGKTTASKYCKILNEDEIELTYDFKKKRLVASAEVPLKIHNSFLGYELEYLINECYIDFEWTTVKSHGVIGWKFSGSTFFKDLTNDSTSYAAKRKMSYRASQMEFFRNLSRHTLGKSNFRLLHGSRYCDPEKYFDVIQRGNDYIVLVKNERLKRKENFYQSFTLEYPGKPDSEVIFLSNVFKLDSYGNYSTFKSISFLGEISNKRIADLLPLDYNMK